MMGFLAKAMIKDKAGACCPGFFDLLGAASGQSVPAWSW
jgi:hypothetical protein